MVDVHDEVTRDLPDDLRRYLHSLISDDVQDMGHNTLIFEGILVIVDQLLDGPAGDKSLF